MQVKKINGHLIAFQNDLPYPSFEIQDRKYLSLNKEWSYKMIKADHDLSLASRSRSVIKKLEQEITNVLQPAFDDSAWETVLLPAVNNLYPSRYQDGCWYRYKFNIDQENRQKLVRLFFQGVNYVADVWLNGQWLGVHEGGYTPFVFNVTPHLVWDKENILVVRVDNIPWLSDNDTDQTSNRKNIVPYKKCDWWNYGGINRDIYLEITDKVYVVRADVQAKPVNQAADCRINVCLHNTSETPVSVTAAVNIFDTAVNSENIMSARAVDIADLDKKLKLSDKTHKTIKLNANKTSVINYRFNLEKVRCWQPDDPHLYVLEIVLKKNNAVVEKFYTQFGIRQIAVADHAEGFTLNAEKIFFNGVARHEDYPDKGKALSFQEGKKILDDLRFIRDMNANFIRTAHYPNHPLTYIMADRIGLAVMEEIPVFWFSGPQFDLQREERGIARQMWLEMIYRDYNRPSIMFWSTCNECGWQDNRREFIWDLKTWAYDVDGSRLVGQSAAGHDTHDGSHQDCDYFGATMYVGVFDKQDPYLGTYKAMDDVTHFYATKPFLATEYGIWSYDSFLNVNEQVRIATNTYKAFKQFSRVGGACWWCAFDWYTMLGYPYQSMGTISLDRKYIKPVYLTLQKLYSKTGQDIKARLTGLEDNAVVEGSLNVQLVCKEPQIKRVYYKFYGTDFILLEGNNTYSLNYNTRSLEEGRNYLVFKILLKNNDCFYVKCDFTVDNRDDAPEFDANLVDKKKYIDKLFLNVRPSDDRRVVSVRYKLDDNDPGQIPEKGGLYIETIDLKKYKDKSSHIISILVKDNGDNLTRKEYRFSIDRTPGIRVDLPFNLDRISYNHNRTDAFEWSLPAEELPESNSWFVTPGPESVRFFLGPKEDGMKNTMEALGQTLSVPRGKYSRIYFLGYTFWGNQEDDVTLIYADGSKQVVQVAFSDWVGANSYMEGEKIGILCSQYHYEKGDGNQNVAVYYCTVNCDPHKDLLKIKMPYDNHKHIFAISLEP